MKSLKATLFFFIVLLISACDHPLEIKGQGDILSSTGQRNCLLEDFQAGKPNCSRNTVQGDYVETYTARARSGWAFTRWENYCTTSASNVCAFAVPADLVQNSFGSTMPPLVAVFSPEGGGNPFFGGAAIPEYMATRVLQSSAGTFTMKEFTTPQKQRIELAAQGTVMINRTDQNVTWLLFPPQKQFMTISGDQFDDQTRYLDREDVSNYVRVGTDTLFGFDAVKYMVTVISDGNTSKGLFWLLPSGILLQIDMTITATDGKQEKFLMFLRDLVIAPQAASLFEIPAGYNPLPSIPSLPIPGIPGLPQGG